MWPNENTINAAQPFTVSVQKAPAQGDVAFLLGAGASVEAQVPDTVHLIQDFAEQTTWATQIQTLLKELREWAKTQGRVVDVELVLETLQRLADWPQEPLAALQRQPVEINGIEPRKVLEALRDFIKQKVVVDPEKTAYLDPLRGFVDSEKPLSVYSLNYDTAIEVFCAKHRLAYRDGFGEDWNPKVFDDQNVDLLLFKLHGSVTWYRTDRGRFLKIPVMLKDSTVRLITTERATALMLYPAQKLAYVEPLFELLLQMKKRLATCQFLVAVGYSFRDDHVRQILWDVARVSPEFTVILISPDAGNVYKEKLAWYASDIPSSLRGRVICLPFAFGKALPVLQREFIKIARDFAQEWRDRSLEERQGFLPPWTQAAKLASQYGHIEAARTILEKAEAKKNIWYTDHLEIVVRGLFFATANNDTVATEYFLTETEKVWRAFVADAEVDVSHIKLQIIAKRNNYQSSVRDLVEKNRALQSDITRYQRLMIENSKASEGILKIRELLMAIEAEMACWDEAGGISPERYAENRKANIELDFQHLLANLQNEKDPGRFKQMGEFSLEPRIRKTESTIIMRIFQNTRNSLSVSPSNTRGM
jgi:hypothetical protein